MKYHYTSCWRSEDASVFHLVGVIVADEQEVALFFPQDREAQKEWRSRIEHREDEQSPLHWLEETAAGGNGITEEFGTVHIVSAPSLHAAMQKAYFSTQQEYGKEMRLYSDVREGDSGVLSHPLADSLSKTMFAFEAPDIVANTDEVLADKSLFGRRSR